MTTESTSLTSKMVAYNSYFAKAVQALILIPSFTYLMIENHRHRIREKELVPEYDYIVIGSGGAGSVVANRLTENANTTVLLLEAGPDNSILSDIPLFAQAAQLTDLDWKYVTTPQEHANLGLRDKVGRLPRGKIVGGSSALHYMMYVRGNKNDYDSWEKEAGVKGWSYKDVLPYFLKAEGQESPTLYPAVEKYHNRHGYLTTNYIGVNSPIASNFLEAGKELGYDQVDYNGPVQTGYSYVQATVRDGSRCSSAKAYIKKAQHRPNLSISLNSFVTKILLDDNKKAYGVQFEKEARNVQAKARKEIILSAGAYASPQLLMVSGIGPEQDLKELNIPVVHNLPGVGKNMQDHVSSAAVVFTVDQNSVPNMSPTGLAETVNDYVLNFGGILASPVALQGLAFVNSKYADPKVDFPDVQLVYLFLPPHALAATKDLYNIGDKVWDGYFKPILGYTTGVFYPMLLRPKSRGELKLKSSNPHDQPLINPNLFSDPEDQDVKVMGEAIRLSYELGKTNAFKKFGLNFTNIVLPGCEKFPQYSDEYWQCVAKYTTITFYHTVGTCSMGPKSNPNAVVDERLRVHGVNGLRVVDASVIPLEITGNVNAPTVMVGEHASDLIKQDNNEFIPPYEFQRLE